MRLPRGLMALTAVIGLVPAGSTASRGQLAGPPAATPIRLVDTQGRPVPGAVAGTAFYRNANPRPRFVSAHPVLARSDARGELRLDLRLDVHRTGIYAIRYDGDRALVGVYKPTLEEVRLGKPMTIIMHPACRVRLRVECPGFRDPGGKYLVEPRVEPWRRLAAVALGDGRGNLYLLTALSMTGEIEFLLPPGRFVLSVGGEDTERVKVPVAVEPGHRVLGLGVIDLPLSELARQGTFFNHHHLSPTDLGGDEPADLLRLRFVQLGLDFRGAGFWVHDLAYSPDGRLLATAHWNNVAAGAVKLWDASTGELAASLNAPVSTGGVEMLAFAPDGRTLAGAVGDAANPGARWAVVLWDVASRREVKLLHGHASRITALAFAPDGRTLASGGDDATVRFWDVASGREAGRIGSNPPAVQSIAYSPDGKTLAVVSRFSLKLWDVPGHRWRATLENGDFWVSAVAFAPDGRTLAAAGAHHGPGPRAPKGHVRLYDMTWNPPAPWAELDPRIEGPDFANPVRAELPSSAVAFTPDGRRVAAIAARSIVVWDVNSGVRQDFVRRHGGGPSDRLALSPDGRWIAATQGYMAQVIDLVPPGP